MTGPPPLREGWYLMSTSELERALAAWRAGTRDAEFGVSLSIDAAIARRDEGNVPDHEDRSLRLVLFVDDEPLERKRLRWEPDYHEAPDWRREGSRPVNVVPLRSADSPQGDGRPWWEIGGMWPGGADRPCAQKIVEALNTTFFFGPG